MNIVYSFIGSLPSYTQESLQQLRLFYHGPVYLIIDDLASPLVPTLREDPQLHIIPYEEVVSYDFNEIVQKNRSKFHRIETLTGREELFMRTFERSFLLYRLAQSHRLENILFVELDNLLYEDPHLWLPSLQRKDVAYMYDNQYRCGAGIAFFRNASSVLQLNQFFAAYIEHPDYTFVHEMKALHDYWASYKDRVQLLPIHWPDPSLYPMVHQEFPFYNDTLFDVASIGIYLGGLDPHHTGGVIQKGLRGLWSYLDYTSYQFEWRPDEKGRKIPFVFCPPLQKWLKINNLHIHSKSLKDCMS